MSPTPATLTEDSFLLPRNWDGKRDLRGWWLCEKLDGVRVLWDGQAFLTQFALRLVPPPWFAAGLPRTPLDGELWAGRGKFAKTVRNVRRASSNPEAWRKLRFVVVDVPDLHTPVEDRLALIQKLFADGAPERVIVTRHAACKGADHLAARLAEILEAGGKGLVARRPGSLYVAGQTGAVLEVKKERRAQAQVMGRRLAPDSRITALEVVLPDGTEFEIADDLPDELIRRGSVIVFGYREIAPDGAPLDPFFVEVVSFDGPEPPRPMVVELQRRKGKSARYCRVEVRGATVTATTGRIGKPGHRDTKTYSSVEKAVRKATQFVKDRITEGYEQVDLAPDGDPDSNSGPAAA